MDGGMSTEPTPLDALAERVIGCAIAVHRALGPGLLESVYHACLLVEFRYSGLNYDTQRHIKLTYRDDEIRPGLMVDLIVEGRLLVELKAVERLQPVIDRSLQATGMIS
jgi:GxxExxY protein